MSTIYYIFKISYSDGSSLVPNEGDVVINLLHLFEVLNQSLQRPCYSMLKITNNIRAYTAVRIIK